MNGLDSFSHSSIRNELFKARRTALWHGKKTIMFAEDDISRLTSKIMIEKIVLRDNMIKPLQKINFVDYVYKNARYVDDDLPLPVASFPTFPNSNLPDGWDDIQFETLISTTQWRFTVPKLSWMGGHTEFHPNSIPPITSMIQIGSGYSGGVYSIVIDPDYVPEDIQQPFAMKIIPSFYPGTANGNRGSSRERDLLNALRRFDHQHIIQLLTSFDYLDQLCMIFPLATCDLHEYMDQEPPKNDPKYVFWLIRQLLGLTEALSKIHGTDKQEIDLIQHETRYHGDIRLENILFFQDSAESGIYGTLRISDFGLAKFHYDTAITERRHTGNIAALGTPRCVSPELLLEGRTIASASYDLWSFGCIILELMIWSQFGKEGREEFLERANGLFYRYQVRKWIERLGCSDLHPSLKRLLEVIETKLLVCDPDKRWTSAQLLDFLSTLEETGTNNVNLSASATVTEQFQWFII